VQAWLLAQVEAAAEAPSAAVDLAGARLIVPDFLGNRAPHADPAAKAVISGLSLASGLEDLVATYVAAVLGVGYGLRQILEAQRAQGVAPDSVVISGGAGAHPWVQQMLADACGLPVFATRCPEPVLLGAAMLGAVAAGHRASLRDCMQEMSHIGTRSDPATGRVADVHAARFAAYEAMQAAERALRTALRS
jgi:D-ribulokinase